MSERNFTRLFREETGRTPGDFVASARLQAACRLLEETPLAAKDVARRSGLGSAAALRRAFGRRLGVSPSQYRDKFRSGRAQTAAHAAG